MFSQFRNAVEQLAQQPIRALDASSPGENQSEQAPRAQSLDMQATRSTSPLSSSQLAESALSSLRKSLVSQRSNSGSSTNSSKTPATSPSPPEPRPHKSNLEERLRRATFAIGDTSGSSTPARSSRVASPSPMGRNRLKQVEQSPASTPLPGSPIVTPAKESEKKLEQPAELSLEDKDSTTSPAVQPTEEQASSAPVIELPPVIQTPAPTEILSTEQDHEDNTKASEVAHTAEPDPQPQLEESGKETESTDDAPAEGTLTKEAQTEDTSTKEVSAEGTLTSDAAPEALDVHAFAEVRSSANESLAVAENPPQATSVDALPFENTISSKDGNSDIQPATPSILPSEPSAKKEEVEAKLEQPPITAPVIDHSAEVESLQARLKQVEQRFSDVSTSFKRIQAEKLAADAILREVSPLETIKDTSALRNFFTNLKTKDQVFQDEIKRLNQKLELQEDRFEEVRDTHKLESQSLSGEVKRLRTQLDETEALFQAAQRATTHAEEAVDKQKDAFSQLQKDADAAKNTAKEEEEKRVKAISLLKTVRQKLVKAEKDKDDAVRELSAVKEREKGDKNKEQAERLNFQQELESLNASHEKATANLKVQFNKDFASMKDRYEQEISAIRGQFELELATMKNTHAKELGAKGSQIGTLENSLNNVTRDKNAFFDQLQQRQAELESAQAHLESLQHQNTEFQFQLRESNDRLALLKEEYQELLREHDSRSRDPAPSADEIARMVSATEAKYEAKLAEMRRNISILEKERYEAEVDWSRKLKEKVKDLEDLKRAMGSATRTREAEENIVAGLKAELAQAQETSKTLERQLSELPLLREQIHELQRSSKEQEQEIGIKIMVFEKQIEENKAREMQLKQSNKTLREELRKVQSSAALLERQRNPGVGYWTTRVADGNGVPETPRAVESPSRVSSPTPSTATSNKNEEEVNLEYLRNVILQFLEHKEMRPNLVKVLSIILHFTPQETRRLIAKV